MSLAENDRLFSLRGTNHYKRQRADDDNGDDLRTKKRPRYSDDDNKKPKL